MRKLIAWLLDRELVTVPLEDVLNRRGWRVRRLIYIRPQNSRRLV